MRWLWLVIGVIVAVVGIVWTLQGLNVMAGSVMSGNHTFVIVGLVGLALIGVGTLRRRAPSA